MSKQQHSLRVVHSVTGLHHEPNHQNPLPLQVVFQDLKAIAELIEKEVSPEENQVQPVQLEQPAP